MRKGFIQTSHWIFAISLISVVFSISACRESGDNSGEQTLSPALTQNGQIVLEHRYDVGVIDESGNGNDGIIHGDPRFRRSCLSRAIVFDGDDDNVEIPYDVSLEPDQVSVEVYFQPKNTLRDGAGFLPIVVKMPDTGNFWNTADGYDLWYQDAGSGGRIGFGIATNNGKLRYSVNWFSNIKPGRYYHLVGTYDGQEMRLYLNGALVDTRAHTDPIAYLGGPIRVGGHIRHSYYGSGYHQFSGSVDELVIYDYALSHDEVRERANRCPRFAAIPEDGPTDIFPHDSPGG